ncbi:hypothetical protein DFH09DRAFT_1084447 [Mycena vulgaris]|nr:hypothetical protein DFH09DRAFT_1084447 [Mycena vulgaris]
MVRSPRARHTNIAALAALKRNKPLDAVRQIRAPGDQALALLELGTGAYLREGPGVLYCVTRAGLVKVGHTTDFDRRSLQYSGCEAPGNALTWILKIPVPHRMLAGTFRFLPALLSSSLPERFVHLLLREFRASLAPALCPGTKCVTTHREWYSLNAVGGRTGLGRLLRRAFRRLHVLFRPYLADITGKPYRAHASLHERRLQHSGNLVIKPVVAALDGQQSALLVYRNETKQRTYFGSRFPSESN